MKVKDSRQYHIYCNDKKYDGARNLNDARYKIIDFLQEDIDKNEDYIFNYKIIDTKGV